MTHFSRFFLFAAAAGALSACASDRGEEQLAYIERPVETLYLDAFDTLEDRRFDDAAAKFDEVERQHPYSAWARRAMLMAAYANYASNNYDAAIEDARRYISLHPGSRSAEYAYYLIAQCYFEQILDVGRDQANTQRAQDALQQVVQRYPDSDYARDAQLKIDMTRDQLAGKEMEVGRFYLRAGHNLAAIGRFQNVVRDFDTTSHTPEALHRLVEAYLRMGLVDEATRIGSVLGYNYPGSEWYEDSYELLTDRGADMEAPEEGRGNFFSRTFGRIF